MLSEFRDVKLGRSESGLVLYQPILSSSVWSCSCIHKALVLLFRSEDPQGTALHAGIRLSRQSKIGWARNRYLHELPL